MAVGRARQSAKDVAQVLVRIDVVPPARFDDGVDDRAAMTGVRLAEEQPILLADGGRPDRIADRL